MAFITNKKRQSLIKRINESYGLKKALVLIEIIALAAYIVVTFLSMYYGKDNPNWEWIDNGELTTLGIGMVVAAAIIVVLGIISVILIFTIRSPKSIKKDIKTLESSALSGKKVSKNQTASEIMRARRTPEDKKKKK